ncbi:MAG: ABC transporter substrate binding protein, partial [Nitrospiraceae bacterium]|nr:ABC transporter substrate binding protein [Nitrospiraceae bacterium]
MFKTADLFKNVEIYYEYLDAKRFKGKRHTAQFFQYLLAKYAEIRLDLVIVTDNDAFQFIRDHRTADLFRSTAIVFCGVSNFEDSLLSGIKHITGVVEEVDIKDTLDIALELHPKTSQVVVISDKTTKGHAIKREVRAIAEHFKGKAKFQFLDDVDDISATVSNLPPNTIILLTSVNNDHHGHNFASEATIDMISHASSVPIYSFWDFYLGKGIVGGILTSGTQQGRTAGELAVRILRGEDASAIPVVRKSPNVAMFDDRQIKRFGIDQRALPADSIVINKPDSFYVRYKIAIMIFLSVIAVLCAAVVVLFVNLSVRKRYERRIEESEKKYRDLYDKAPDMYHAVDSNGIVTECNETEAAMLGYRKQEIIGRPISDFFTEASKQAYERQLAAGPRDRTRISVER